MPSTVAAPLQYVTELPPLPGRAADVNKGSCGRVAVIGGSRGMAGAPCLAARGAYRGGAGLVRVAVPSAILDVVASKLDECLTDGLPCNKSGAFSRSAAKDLLQICDWADVAVIGPGMTQSPETVVVLWRIVAETNTSLVVDADGLNAFHGGKAKLFLRSQQKKPQRKLVLTPHPGEMARLLDIPIAEVQAHRGRAAAACCRQTGAVVILKGAGTLVCDGQRLFRNTTGNPGMATGGTGDVLAGLVGALIGQGMDAFEAACLGAHLHGLAGDLAAKRLGVWSLTAGDLVEEVPNAFLAYAKTTGVSDK